MHYTEITPEAQAMIRDTVESTIYSTLAGAWPILKSQIVKELHQMILDKAPTNAVAQAQPAVFDQEAVDRIGNDIRRVVQTAVDHEMLVIRMHLHRISAVLLDDVPTDC